MATNAPLRIAVWHFLPSGGGRRALYQHIKGLIGRGHSVELWCPDLVDDGFLPLGDLVPEHVVPLKGATNRGLLSEAFDLYRGTRADVENMDRHCRDCAAQIAEGNFDLLFANTSMHYAVTAIGRLLRLPKVLYLQEPLRELYEASPDLPWRAPEPRSRSSSLHPGTVANFIRDTLRVRKLGILIREEQKNAGAFDRILVNSLFSRESVMRAYGLRARVCHLGIDTDLFNNLDLPREPFVVGVGAIVPAKAIERAIEAIAAIEENRPRLEWIGNAHDGAYRQNLERLAEEHEVGVTFRVNIPEDELVERLNRAAVMIYAPRLEPFGYVPLEASACGLPVVGVREGGVRETVRDGFNGFLTDDDPRSLATALEKVLESPELGRTMGSNGRRWVCEEWGVDRAIDRLEGHLFDLLGRGETGTSQ